MTNFAARSHSPKSSQSVFSPVQYARRATFTFFHSNLSRDSLDVEQKKKNGEKKSLRLFFLKTASELDMQFSCSTAIGQGSVHAFDFSSRLSRRRSAAKTVSNLSRISK